MVDRESTIDPTYNLDAQARVKGFSLALAVQHQNAPFRSQRLCSQSPRRTADPRYPNGEIPIRIRYAGNGYRHPSFGNLVGCGNVWMCARCSEAKSYARRQQINIAADTWLAEKLPLYMLTLTVPHTATDRLEDLLAAKSEAWKAVTNDRAFRLMRQSGVLAGYIAVMQIKFRRPPARTRGWHVHMHVVLFLSDELSTEQRDDFEKSARSAWRGALIRAGLATPLSSEHGSDLRRISANFGIGHYLSATERFVPGEDLEAISTAGLTNEDRLVSHDAKSQLPMELFYDFLRRRTAPVEGGAPVSRFYDLPKGGAVYFDGRGYLVVSDSTQPARVRIAKADYPWFEFQLAVRRKKKTVFSHFDSTTDVHADQLWRRLRKTPPSVDDASQLGEYIDFHDGAGRDIYLIDQKSWRKSLARNERNRAAILLAAGKGDDQFFTLARELGLIVRRA